jgi:cell division protein FtsZ
MAEDELFDELNEDYILQKEISAYQTKIKVIGAGGAGNNTVHRLFKNNIKEITTVAVNTDAQNLLEINSNQKILIGKKLTNGLGAGGDPEIGERAAEESNEALLKIIENSDMLFLVGGLGGGTGTGSLPVIAKMARKLGALTVAIVTMPFSVEGIIRWENAQIGLEKLRNQVDTVIVLNNDKLIELFPDLPMNKAFQKADQILLNALTGLSNLVLQKGLINLDFADISMVMRDGPNAVIGVGRSNSENRAEEAAIRAVTHPLMEWDISGAQSALINVSGGQDLTLKEARHVVRVISQKLDPTARIIWGINIEKSQRNYIQVMLIVAGLQEKDEETDAENKLSNQKIDDNTAYAENINNSETHSKSNQNIFDIKESISSIEKGENESTQNTNKKTITKTTVLFYKIFEDEANTDLKRFDRGIQLLRENPGSRRAIIDTKQACKLLHASAQMFGFDEMSQLLSSIEKILACAQSRELQLTLKIIDSITLAMEMVVDLMENRSDGRGETGYIVDRLSELKEEQLEYNNTQKTWIKH